MANTALDPNVFTNGMETLANISKVAANLSDGKGKKNPPQEKKVYQGGESTNQPHNQTVEVKVGDPNGNNQKPMVLREKHETHIHKPYPDGRELSAGECEVEKLRIQTAHENEKEERAFRMEMEDRARKERKERFEREREEQQRKRDQQRKSEKRALIFGGLTVAGLLGLSAYCIYTADRNPGIAGPALQQPGKGSLKISFGPRHGKNQSAAIEGEGTVE